MIKLDHIDRNEALRYLACRDEQTISKKASLYLDECEKRLLDVITPKFLYRRFPLVFKDGQPVILGCSLELKGDNIAAHLEGCSQIILMCATCGQGADRLIRLLQIEDMAKAVIADAFAGAAVEQVCNECERLISAEYKEKYFTWRYSPGYGDFPLDTQKQLLNVLDAPKRIGLCTSDTMLLTPVKSVTAVIGVSDTPIPRKKSGCITCHLKDVCQYRKRGTHCGY